jgi:predicted site-specific integrase-resolvase
MMKVERDGTGGLPRLVSVRNIAQAFGVSPRTVERWRARGILRPVPLPDSNVRYRLSDVEAILNDPAPEKRNP